MRIDMITAGILGLRLKPAGNLEVLKFKFIPIGFPDPLLINLTPHLIQTTWFSFVSLPHS
jgi:hypothetical protein